MCVTQFFKISFEKKKLGHLLKLHQIQTKWNYICHMLQLEKKNYIKRNMNEKFCEAFDNVLENILYVYIKILLHRKKIDFQYISILIWLIYHECCFV